MQEGGKNRVSPLLNMLDWAKNVQETESKKTKLQYCTCVLIILSLKHHVRVIDAEVRRQLAVLLKDTRLVGAVLQNDVGLLVLVVAQADQDDITLPHPDLLPHLATNVAHALLAVYALHGIDAWQQ